MRTCKQFFCICYQFKAWIPTGSLPSGSAPFCWSGFFKKPKKSHRKLTHSASDVFFFLSPWVYKEISAALGITLSFDKAALAARSHSQIFHWQNKWFLIEVSFSFPRRPAGRGRFLTMQNKINNKSLASPHEPDNCQIAVPLKAKLN